MGIRVNQPSGFKRKKRKSWGEIGLAEAGTWNLMGFCCVLRARALRRLQEAGKVQMWGAGGGSAAGECCADPAWGVMWVSASQAAQRTDPPLQQWG